MKVLRWFFTVIGIVYVIGVGALYLNQEQLIFLNEKLPVNYRFRIGEEVLVKVDNEVHLSCIYVNRERPEGLILYLHGNKGNNRRCIRQLQQFDFSSYDLFMPDYRGYGKSGGKCFSEDQVLSDMQKVYNYIVQEIKPKKIVIVGYSLGSGMASYLAAENDVDQLFLLAPYTSISDVKDMRYIPVPDFLVKYDLDTSERIAQIDCPITLFHSHEDQVIPYKCSQLLTNEFPDKVNLVTINSSSHRGLIFNNRVSNHISAALH